MASPITVTTTPTLLIGKNRKRKVTQLQNTGSDPVYVKKWPYNVAIAPVPSSTNYDFILNAKPGEGNKEDEIHKITSVSAFVGVTASKTSTVAVMETVEVMI